MDTGREERSYLCEVMGSYKEKIKQCVGFFIITAIITVLLYILVLLTYWSQQAPVLIKYPQWGLAKDHPWWGNQTAQTHFPQKDCLHFPAQSDVFCRMPDGEQGLQGHRKEVLFEWYLKTRRANDTHTQSTSTKFAYNCKVYKCVMRNMMTF